MAEQSTRQEAKLVGELNDLLQLDHDAVQAYTLAIDHLESEPLRSTLMEFRADHERHISELTRLIRQHEGVPVELAHIPTGAFKLAVQRLGTAGGDRSILLAFKANEGQVVEKYRRAARNEHPMAVGEVLNRNLADEERHYRWVTERLEEMGAGEDTMIGKAEGAFERAHGATANMIEGAEEWVMEGAETVRRAAKEAPDRAMHAAGSGLESAAGAADRIGDWVERRDGAMGQRAGSAAHQVADSLEDAATYLRTQDLGAMRSDLEMQVDRHPIRSVLIAAAAGFLLGKLLD